MCLCVYEGTNQIKIKSEIKPGISPGRNQNAISAVRILNPTNTDRIVDLLPGEIPVPNILEMNYIFLPIQFKI